MTSEAVGYGMAPCATCEACARRDAEIERLQARRAAWRKVARRWREKAWDAADFFERQANTAEAERDEARAQLAAIRDAWRPEEYAGFRAVSGEQGVVYAITAEQRAAIDAALGEVEP